EGKHIVIRVNGQTTVDAIDQKPTYDRGHFALQVERPLNTVVEFRKVEVKELPATYTHGQTIAGWGEVIDPNRDCKFAGSRDELTITVPGGHHNLHPSAPFQNLSAPRVLQKVTGDFDVQVRVQPFSRPKAITASTGKNSYVGAGFLLWQDEKNFIRFFR